MDLARFYFLNRWTTKLTQTLYLYYIEKMRYRIILWNCGYKIILDTVDIIIFVNDVRMLGIYILFKLSKTRPMLVAGWWLQLFIAKCYYSYTVSNPLFYSKISPSSLRFEQKGQENIWMSQRYVKVKSYLTILVLLNTTIQFYYISTFTIRRRIAIN